MSLTCSKTIHDLTPAFIASRLFRFDPVNQPTCDQISVLSLMCSLNLFVLFPSQFLRSLASLRTWNSSNPRTGANILAAHSRKGSAVRLTPGTALEEVTLIFDTLLFPFHHSPFMYSQLSCLLFSL